MRRSFVLLVVAACAASVGIPSAPAANDYFETPSRNIACGWFSDSGGYLRCEISSLLRPLPLRPRSCDLDWGYGISMGRTGQARPGALCGRHRQELRPPPDPSVRLDLADGRLQVHVRCGRPDVRERLLARLLPQPRALAHLLINPRG